MKTEATHQLMYKPRIRYWDEDGLVSWELHLPDIPDILFPSCVDSDPETEMERIYLITQSLGLAAPERMVSDMDLDLVYIQMAASDCFEEARNNGNLELAKAYDELAQAAGYVASMLEDEDD